MHVVSRASSGPHSPFNLTLGAIHKLQILLFVDLLISSVFLIWPAIPGVCPGGRGAYPEHRQFIAGISHLGRAMAVVSCIWDANRGCFLVLFDDAKWSSEHIDAAIEIEQESICRANMPRQGLTIGYGKELLVSSTGPSAERDPEEANATSS